MADHCFVLGIDVGTGGAKAIVIDETGAVHGNCTTEYPLSTPQPLWSEQDPEDWWQATRMSIRTALDQARLDSERIAAVGLTGQMHGLVLLDGVGTVLRPAILWNDQRTARECDLIHDRVGLDHVIAITGKPVMTGFTAPKVLWVRQHEPEVHARAEHLLLPKDYVRYRLSGAHASDAADASGTSLFDISRRAWSEDILEALEIPTTWLPQVTESPEVSSSVRAGCDSGLAAGTPIVAGAGDQAAQAVGCGVVTPGQVSVTIGTSGVVFAVTESARIDPAGVMHAYCHAVPGACHVMGVMLSAGGSLRWYRDTLGDDVARRADAEGVDTYDILLREAASIPPGSEGLLFLPYLTGERTPYADPFARGAFIGLTVRHTRAHLTQAVIEGISLGLRDCYDLLGETGRSSRPVRLSGGGARSPHWRQVLADVFNLEMATVNVTEGGAFGAALLALVGAGAHRCVEDAAGAVVRETSRQAPGKASGPYRKIHQTYRKLYPVLSPVFRHMEGGPGVER